MAKDAVYHRKPKYEDPSTDEGTIKAGYGGTPGTTGLSSKTVYRNNLRQKYVDVYGQQPVKQGNYYDEDTRKNTSTHMSNSEIRKTLGAENKAKAKRKK